MNKKNIIEVLDLLRETFCINLSYNIFVFSKEKDVALIRVVINGADKSWQYADLYFNKNGDILPNYKEQKQLELNKKTIKKLQEVLENY